MKTTTQRSDVGSPGPSVRVATSNGVTQVLSSPYPIHQATVSRSHALGRWLVVVETAQVITRDFRDMRDALRHAGTVVATLYRIDMNRRFTGPQRHAMAMGQCPMHVACDDRDLCTITRPDHKHICRLGADFMSIWCRHHHRSGGDGHSPM